MQKGADYIGVVVDFRDPDPVYWKQIIELKSWGKKKNSDICGLFKS